MASVRLPTDFDAAVDRLSVFWADTQSNSYEKRNRAISSLLQGLKAEFGEDNIDSTLIDEIILGALSQKKQEGNPGQGEFYAFCALLCNKLYFHHIIDLSGLTVMDSAFSAMNSGEEKGLGFQAIFDAYNDGFAAVQLRALVLAGNRVPDLFSAPEFKTWLANNIVEVYLPVLSQEMNNIGEPAENLLPQKLLMHVDYFKLLLQCELSEDFDPGVIFNNLRLNQSIDVNDVTFQHYMLEVLYQAYSAEKQDEQSQSWVSLKQAWLAPKNYADKEKATAPETGKAYFTSATSDTLAAALAKKITPQQVGLAGRSSSSFLGGDHISADGVGRATNDALTPGMKGSPS